MTNTCHLPTRQPVINLSREATCRRTRSREAVRMMLEALSPLSVSAACAPARTRRISLTKRQVESALMRALASWRLTVESVVAKREPCSISTCSTYSYCGTGSSRGLTLSKITSRGFCLFSPSYALVSTADASGTHFRPLPDLSLRTLLLR